MVAAAVEREPSFVRMLKAPPPEFIWSFIFTSGGWLTFCALVYLVITAYQARTTHNDAPWVSAIRAILEDDSTYPPTASVELPVEIMPHLLLGDKACTAKPELLRAGCDPRTHGGREGREVALHRAMRQAPRLPGRQGRGGVPLIYAHQLKVSEFIRDIEKAAQVPHPRRRRHQPVRRARDG